MRNHYRRVLHQSPDIIDLMFHGELKAEPGEEVLIQFAAPGADRIIVVIRLVVFQFHGRQGCRAGPPITSAPRAGS